MVINQLKYIGENPFHMAIRRNDLATVELFLVSGIDANVEDSRGNHLFLLTREKPTFDCDHEM